MTIAYGIELILEVAVALGVTRYVYDRFGIFVVSDWIYVASFLSSFAVAGSIGLIIELVRKQSPEQWGPGRWVWSLSSVYMFLICGRWLVLKHSNPLDYQVIMLFCRTGRTSPRF